MIAYLSLILTAVLTALDYEILFKKDVKPKFKKGVKSKKNTKPKSRLKAWLQLFLLVIITIILFVKQRHDDKVNATNGQLETLSFGNTLKKSDHQIKHIPVKLGSNYINVSERELNSGASIPLVVYNNSDPGSDNLTIRTFNDKVFINATVRSFEGKIVAKIVNNEWQTSTNPQHYDRNYDDTGFEVIDSYGVVVLQVSMQNDTIKILGVIDRDTGKDFIVDYGVELYSVAEGIKRYIELGKKITPLFKYPSEDNMGVRER